MISFSVILKELLLSEDHRIIFSNLEQLGDIKLYGVSPLGLARSFHPNWLYLAGPGEEVSGLHTGALLIVGGMPESLPAGIPAVVCGSSGQPEDTYDLLVETFARYQSWLEGLEQCVKNEDTQKMLDLSYPLFRATVSLFDSDYRWIGISGPEYPFYRENNHQLPADFIRAVKDDDQGGAVYRHRAAFVAPDPMGYFNTQALCYNLFIHDRYWGRLVVMDQRENREFLAGDHWLLNVLGERMQTLLRQRMEDVWSPQTGGTQAIHRCLHRLLNREPVEPGELARALDTSGWDPEECYFVGYLFLNLHHTPASAGAFYCRYIAQEYPGVAALDRDSHILLLIPRSRYPKITGFLSGFVLTLRENNFRLGISELCRELGELYYYYLQAEAAFSIGSRRKPHHWYHIFSDWALDHLLQSVRDVPVRYFCSEKLRCLADYDRENSTEYVKTLKTYIRNQMNAVQTARDLYIHHATMVFRLKRLKEIMDVDLRDMEQIVQLYLSLRILELSEPQ